MSSVESECGIVVDGRLRIGREGQGVDYSWRSQPEGIDFSCSLLFQSWLEDSSLAPFQNPRVQNVTQSQRMNVIQQPISFSVCMHWTFGSLSMHADA
jgi:hypothetical protein